ncbi:WD40-repeat-containing domain protein [Entophlyctis helioformis]|nr:WD40-repeat-containing domain protein [Entophlyctis helioformis]
MNVLIASGCTGHRASFDGDVRVWDARTGSNMFVLSGHSEPVYSISFSPSGLYLASGSFDHRVFVWSMKDGSLIKTHRGDGGVFEVAWNGRGDRLAVCYTDNKIVLVNAGAALPMA